MNFLKPYCLITFFFLFAGAIAFMFNFSLPIYQGPDEQVHYATIQYHSEPEEKNWPIQQEKNKSEMQSIADFHFSEEIIKTGTTTQFDDIKWQESNTQEFAVSSLNGKNEEFLRSATYKRYIDIYPHNISTNTSYYYWIASFLEKTFSGLDILDRFFLMRFLSLLFYLGTVVITFQIARRLFETPIKQFLFTSLIAFQPMLLATGVIVNIDIALIFGSALFFWGALGLLTKPSLKSHVLLVFGLLVSFLGKAPGIAFAPILLLLYLFFFQKKYQISYEKIARYGFYSFSLIILLVILSVPHEILVNFLNLGASSRFPSLFQSITSYLHKTLALDDFLRTHASYWGNFGWLDTKINALLLRCILVIEIVAWFGAALFLFSKKSVDYLPKKAFIVLSLGLLLTLQFAIRFYDWRVFDATGKVIIGAPGRYFLPTIIPHFVILITGLGFLFTKNKSQFTTLLKTLAIGMILLCIYSLFNVIIPRYYL